MKHSSKRSSSLFLMELIIVLFFFIITSVCCTQMFVKAWLTSKKASDMNRAENYARNVAEVLECSEGGGDILKKTFPEMIKDGNQYLVCYDEKWQVCDRKKSYYRMEIVLDSNQNHVLGDIRIKDKKEKEIYQLDIVKHIPRRSNRKE